jgi:tetratricopeptide (TPR) repeat protein
MNPRHIILITGLVLLILTGCASTQGQKSGASPSGAQAGQSTASFSPSDPAFDYQLARNRIPEKDRALWQYRTGLNALRAGNHELAKQAFDDALLSIGGIAANDKSAKRARGYFSAESTKTFMGEPYERVMAFFYRGILYWMDGEPDNARACFRSAQLHDGDSENREYASDYVLLDYLDGLASAKLAADGSDAFKRANDLFKNGTLPPYDPDANVLIFMEYGAGPLKYAAGEHAQQLRFRSGTSPVRSATVRLQDQSIPAPAYDDLYFQATTRGGRVMDHILANKAVFKDTTDTVGNVALVGGAVLAHNRNTREAGLGLFAAGLITKVVAASTTPAADTRMWENLPQYLSFAALRLPPGTHVAHIEFNDAAGRAIPRLTKEVTINIPDGARDCVVFISDKSKAS